jgi:hypothetical protein
MQVIKTKKMRILRIIKPVIMVVTICLSSPLTIFQADAVAKEIAGGHGISAQLLKLNNATCLTCHDASKGKLKISDATGGSRPLYGINKDKFGKSVHGEMQCIACHKDITDAVSPHKKGAGQKAECVSCHLALWETAKKENMTREKARFGVVVKNIETYKNSFHARPKKEDKSHVNAACDDCHNTHTFNVPPQGASRRTDWHLTIPNVCGEKCHTDELEEYATSVHGKQVLEEHNPKAAVCTDCHTTHGIANTSKDTFKVSITENCGSCHVENLKSYRATYHGQINKLGYGYTAKCYDCHGSHGILSPKDPESKVHPDNRLKTCQKCHKGATQGFVTFSPHANTHDLRRYPQVWIVSRFMWALLAGVFAFFWLHTGLWWYREAKDRKVRKNHPDWRKEAK